MSLDIDTLIAKFEPIQIRMRTDTAGCGYLDARFDEDLPNDAKLKMPLWMIEPLYKRGMVKLDPARPKDYSRRFFTAWLVEPEHYDLPPLYYDVGELLSETLRVPNILDFFLDGFHRRQLKILEIGDAKRTEKTEEYFNKLCDMEKKIMEGSINMQAYNAPWRNGKTAFTLRVKPGPSNQRKRKREDD